jgi:potassium/hydrogen antiporter
MNDLVTISLLLLFGTLCSILAFRLKVSNVFFLVLAGMIFGILNYVNFDSKVIILISELALIMVVFDATSKLNFKNVIKHSKDALNLNMIYFFLTIIGIGFTSMYFLNLNSSILISGILVSLLSIIVYGIDPAITLSTFSKTKSKITELLEIESIINTPLTLIIAILLIKFLNEGTINFSEQFILFLQQLFVPIGVGISLGFFIVMILKNNYFDEISHLMVITSAIISYVLSELMQGSGVLAVTTFGLIFGNYKFKHKLELEKFASIFAKTLQILVFILLGIVIVNSSSERTFDQLIIGSFLFLFYLIIRYVSIIISLKKLNFREKLFMTLNVPKGIDVAIIILLIINTLNHIEGISFIINISLLFVLYSIVLSTISSIFNEWFFNSKKLTKKIN